MHDGSTQKGGGTQPEDLTMQVGPQPDVIHAHTHHALHAHMQPQGRQRRVAL